jgi:hypothetical protein
LFQDGPGYLKLVRGKKPSLNAKNQFSFQFIKNKLIPNKKQPIKIQSNPQMILTHHPLPSHYISPPKKSSSVQQTSQNNNNTLN